MGSETVKLGSMDNLKWRIWAKIVAYVDLVVLGISLLLLMVMLFIAATITAGTNAIGHDRYFVDKYIKPYLFDEDGSTREWLTPLLLVVVGGVWTVVAIYGLLTGIYLWASIQLLGSSEPGIQSTEALGKARVWRNVNFLFFVPSLIVCVLTLCWISLLIIIVWYGIAFIVVYKFIKELEFIMTTTPGGTKCFPENVIISKL